MSLPPCDCKAHKIDDPPRTAGECDDPTAAFILLGDRAVGSTVRFQGIEFVVNSISTMWSQFDGGLEVSMVLRQGIASGKKPAANKKEEKAMMEQLRTLNIDRVDLDDAIGLLTFAKQAKATYVEMGLEAPAWFADKVAGLEAYIKQRRVENLTKAAKEIEAELGKLKTAEEKRSDLRARLEQIQAALGK